MIAIYLNLNLRVWFKIKLIDSSAIYPALDTITRRKVAYTREVTKDNKVMGNNA